VLERKVRFSSDVGLFEHQWISGVREGIVGLVLDRSVGLFCIQLMHYDRRRQGEKASLNDIPFVCRCSALSCLYLQSYE